MRRQEEYKLCCVIADWLRVALPPRAVWSHLPFGENRDPVTGARLKRIGTARGWPDYLILVDHILVGRAFADAFVAAGGYYAVCRSLEAVEAFLRDCGVPLLVRAPARLAA